MENKNRDITTINLGTTDLETGKKLQKAIHEVIKNENVGVKPIGLRRRGRGSRKNGKGDQSHISLKNATSNALYLEVDITSSVDYAVKRHTGLDYYDRQKMTKYLAMKLMADNPRNVMRILISGNGPKLDSLTDKELVHSTVEIIDRENKKLESKLGMV